MRALFERLRKGKRAAGLVPAVFQPAERSPAARPEGNARGNQLSSSIGLPDGRTVIGRPAGLVYCACVSMPRCAYIVASTSCGVFGSRLGKAPFSSDEPTTRPPWTGPPASAALKTLG